MTYTFTHKVVGKFPDFGKDFATKSLNVVTKLGNIAEEESKAVYLKNRKTQNQVSWIIQSFTNTPNIVNNYTAICVVTAGGPTAPYTKYVEYAREHFRGYYFMRAGWIKATESAMKILKEEFGHDIKISGPDFSYDIKKED